MIIQAEDTRSDGQAELQLDSNRLSQGSHSGKALSEGQPLVQPPEIADLKDDSEVQEQELSGTEPISLIEEDIPLLR